MHAWTLRALFRLTRYYDSIRARGMLSTVMLPLADLTLQVGFKVLDTLTPVWSHSLTTKPRILAMYRLQHLPDLGRKVDAIPPNPKLKSVLRTFGEVFSTRKCFFLWKTLAWRAGPGQGSVMV